MVRTNRWTKAVCALTVAVIVSPYRASGQALPRVAAAPATLPSSAALSTDPLTLLRDPDVPQDLRDSAALRLISSRDESLRTVLVDILRDNKKPGGQLAVAKALGNIYWPKPEFIDPLFDMLNGQESAQVSALALAQYRENPGVLDMKISIDVLGRLIRIANTPKPFNDVRVPVIRSIGAFSQKQAAQALIGLQQNTSSAVLQGAAGDALMAMTGLNDNGHNLQLWQQWWNQNANRAQETFEQDLIRQRGQAFAAANQAGRASESGIARLLTANYNAARDRDQRNELLLMYLRSTDPTVRTLGAYLVSESLSLPGAAPSTAVLREVRFLVGDAQAGVRAEAAHALFQDRESAPTLEGQLGRETDEIVRIQLVSSLAPLKDRPAIQLMLDILAQDRSLPMVIAACNGIDRGADVISADPQLKRRAIDILTHILPGLVLNTDARAAVVLAMADLADLGLRSQLTELTKPSEPTEVRVNALRGLGNLKLEDLGDYLAESMGSDNPDIRLAAIEALRGTPQVVQISALLNRVIDIREVPRIRGVAWSVLESWMDSPKISTSDLDNLADRLAHANIPDAPEKELEVLEKTRDRLLKETQNPAAADAAAGKQEVIGDLMVNPLKQYLPAADQYRLALDHWKSHGGPSSNISKLSEKIATALLLGQDWTNAAKFASNVIRDAQKDPNMGPVVEAVSNHFQTTGEKLANSNDPKAMDFFNAVTTMDPPFRQTYLDYLAQLRATAEKNRARPTPQGR